MTNGTIDLRDLAPFVAVAEELSFSRAAKRLGRAQPPLSRQIRGLEERLGAQLLSRGPWGVALTDAGRSFLGEARAILAHAERAARTAKQVAAGQVGRLRVGHVDSAASKLLPAALRAFHDQAPGVRLALCQSTSLSLLEGLRAGEVDVAFVRPPVGPGLAAEALVEEPLVVALPSTHSLASREQVSLLALSDEAFVLWPRASDATSYDRIVEACARAGFSPTVVEEAFPISSVVLLVAAGLGVSVVPAFASTQVCQEGVAYGPLSDPGAMIGLSLAWREDEQSPVVQAFIQVSRKVASRFSSRIAEGG